ncbi:MAG: DUF2723 domain-containing protein [candidate division WOR-3 bacterium]
MKIGEFLFEKFKNGILGFFIVFFILFSVYLYTIAPTVSFWDCGEFIACAHILGVPHPPGTPFYVLIGRIFDIILPFKEVAKRINIISALSTACAGGFLYLVIIKVLKRFKENKGKEISSFVHLIAIFSSIGAGFCFSVWDSAVEAEVYAPSLFCLVLGLWIILSWEKNIGEKGNDNLLLILLYLLALSFGIHMMPLLLLPGVFLFIILSNWKVLKNPKIIIWTIFLILIGVSTYFYLMIRARANPPINENAPKTFAKLWSVIRREQYGKMNLYPRHTSLATGLSFFPALFEQFKVFFKYFSWQFFPYPRENVGHLLQYVSIIGTSLYVLMGLWGIILHFKFDKKSFWLLFILYILLTAGLVVYLNHEFSPSDPNPTHQPREPRERDYFWGAGFFLFMFYVFISFYYLYERFFKKKNFRYYVVGLSFIFGFIPFVSNIKSHVNRRGNWIADEYAYNLLSCPEENSILFTNGDNDTFPLWFLQEVKGYRKFDAKRKKGVRVACLPLMNGESYIKQMKLDGIPMDFDSPFRGTGIEATYLRERKSGKTNLEFEDWVIDNVGYLPTKDNKLIFRKEIVIRNIILSSQGIKPTYEALTLPVDSFVKRYIKEDFNPSINIYYSVTVAFSETKWLEGHLLLEGFAFKLVGKREKNMNIPYFIDLFKNKLRFEAAKNPNVYVGEADESVFHNYVYVLYNFGAELRREVLPDHKLLNIREYRRNLEEEEKQKLRNSANLLKTSIILAKDSVLLSIVLNELRGEYFLLREPDSLLVFIEEILKRRDYFPVVSFFKGIVLLDKLVISENLNQEQRNKLEEKIEKIFEEVIRVVDEKEKANGYIGLFELYKEINATQKMELLVKELVLYPEFFYSVFAYYYNLKRDKETSIYLLKNWLEVNKYDKKAENLLNSLTGGLSK